MLIKGITNGKIKTTDDLDSITQQAVSTIFPELYKEDPERKGLWLMLETNFRDPLHNVDDMVAAMQAIKYYQLYKTDRQAFNPKYLRLLKEGYHGSPANLLKKLSIDIQQDDVIDSVVKMAVEE